jgi:hypothetical protein
MKTDHLKTKSEDHFLQQAYAELAYDYSSSHDRKFVIQRLERIESGIVVVYFKVI